MALQYKSNVERVILYIQADSPGKDKESNWLPAPKDDFVVLMRLYWPKEKDPSVLNGSWKVPALKRLDRRRTTGCDERSLLISPRFSPLGTAHCLGE
jgi:hypothetical protein